MHPSVDVEDLRLNYDPEKPQARFVEGGVATAALTAAARLPTQVPWPAAAKPTPAPLHRAPADHDDLSPFKGYDAVVMTWTSAEAATLASLLSPGVLTSEWYEYRHGK
jgi:hypothetical protein